MEIFQKPSKCLEKNPENLDTGPAWFACWHCQRFFRCRSARCFPMSLHMPTECTIWWSDHFGHKEDQYLLISICPWFTHLLYCGAGIQRLISMVWIMPVVDPSICSVVNNEAGHDPSNSQGPVTVTGDKDDEGTEIVQVAVSGEGNPIVVESASLTQGHSVGDIGTKSTKPTSVNAFSILFKSRKRKTEVADPPSIQNSKNYNQ